MMTVIDRPISRNKASIALACVLLSYAVFFRVVLISNGWPVFDSDQAILGLMARHIWLHGEHPLFFYGQYYNGPVEAYVAAPVFALFGSSVLTLRLAMLPFIVLFLLLVYVLGRIAYGPAAAVVALAWLTIGPSIAVSAGLSTGDGKQEELVLSGVIVLCAWARLRQPERRPRGRRAWLQSVAIYALLGAASGLAVWSDWLSAPIIVVTVFVLLYVRPVEVLSWSGGALVLGFLLGGWPFIQFNFTNQFASVNQLLYFSGNSNGTLVSHLAAFPSQVASAAEISLPALFGGLDVCAQAQAVSPCSLGNAGFSGLIMALYILAAWPVVRAMWAYSRSLRLRLKWLKQVPRRILLRPVAAVMMWRRLDAPVSEADALRSARLWVQGLLLVSAVVNLAAFVNNPTDQLYPLANTRYLIPLYLSALILFGALWDAMRPALKYGLRGLGWGSSHQQDIQPGSIPSLWAHLTLRRKTLAVAASATLALLLSLSAANGAMTVLASTDSGTYALPEPPAIARILAIFDAHGVRTFYSDSYYDCYNLAFESNERQVCAVLDPAGGPAPETWINRYTPYVSAVTSDPHPAYLLPASPAEENDFKLGNLPGSGYLRTVVEGYAIYYYAGASG